MHSKYQGAAASDRCYRSGISFDSHAARSKIGGQDAMRGNCPTYLASIRSDFCNKLRLLGLLDIASTEIHEALESATPMAPGWLQGSNMDSCSVLRIASAKYIRTLQLMRKVSCGKSHAGICYKQVAACSTLLHRHARLGASVGCLKNCNMCGSACRG